MVVKLGVNLLEAKSISKSNYREFFVLYPFVIPIFKAATGRFHQSKNTVNGYYYQISFNFTILLQSPSEELYLHLLEYYYHLKLLNTLPLLIYQHLNLLRQQSNVLHPKSINAA
jgi:hypothetical protein